MISLGVGVGLALVGAAVGSSFPATTRTGDGKITSGPCEAFARKSPERAA